MKLVGTYQLGFRMVRVYGDPTTSNGHVDLTPDDKGAAQIVIGIDAPWGEAVGTLLHEAYECTLIELNTRYRPHPSFSSESSDLVFIATHNQLSEAHERMGEFLAKVLPDFAKIYNKFSPRKD